MCGTLDYLPPEMLTRAGGRSPHNHHITYDNKIDVWSVGILAYEFVVGKPPFETGSHRQTHEKIRQLDYSFPKETSGAQAQQQAPRVSAECRDFVMQCLKSKAHERAELEQLERHPWIVQNTTITAAST